MLRRLLVAIRPLEGTLSLAAPRCFSRKAGYEPAPGFTFSLPFIIIPHNTITLHKQLHSYSHPNLNFLPYTIQMLIPHIMWSAQAVRDLKIDHTQCHLAWNPKHVIVQWVGIGTDTSNIKLLLLLLLSSSSLIYPPQSRTYTRRDLQSKGPWVRCL